MAYFMFQETRKNFGQKMLILMVGGSDAFEEKNISDHFFVLFNASFTGAVYKDPHRSNNEIMTT